MNKNYLTGIGIALAIVLGLVGTFRNSTVIEQVTKTFGGTSPDIASPYINVGGISEWYGQTQNLIQATTTICSIQSPAATSTLIYATLHMNVATTGGATTLTFAKAVQGATATTSLITAMNTSVGSGAEANAVSSSSMIFSPNQVLNVSQAGGGSFIGGTFSETGVCQAKWAQISY